MLCFNEFLTLVTEKYNFVLYFSLSKKTRQIIVVVNILVGECWILTIFLVLTLENTKKVLFYLYLSNSENNRQIDVVKGNSCGECCVLTNFWRCKLRKNTILFVLFKVGKKSSNFCGYREFRWWMLYFDEFLAYFLEFCDTNQIWEKTSIFGFPDLEYRFGQLRQYR